MPSRPHRVQSPTGWPGCLQERQPSQIFRTPRSRSAPSFAADCAGRPPGAAPGQQRPGTGQPGVAQHVSDGVAEPGQVIERLFRDLVIAVGLADGQGQPEQEAGFPPPRRGQAALGGQGDRGLPQAVIAGELAVLDAAGMGVGELPVRVEQQELSAAGRRADPRVIDRLGRGDAQQRGDNGRPGLPALPRTMISRCHKSVSLGWVSCGS